MTEAHHHFARRSVIGIVRQAEEKAANDWAEAIDREEEQTAKDLAAFFECFETPKFTNTVPMVYPSCQSGPCKQGRLICPTPEACRLPAEVVETKRPIFGMLIALVALAGFIYGSIALYLREGNP